MGLLATTLSLLLLTPPAQDVPPAPPTPEAIASYRKKLEDALEPGAEEKVWRRQVLASRDHVDASVIAVLDAKALRHADRAVRDAAVDALGHMGHPAAAKALEEMLRRDEKELEKEPPRYANLIRAIARKGTPSAIPLLVKDLFQSPDRGVIQARILGLAGIRAKESVDELIQMMRSVPRPRMADFGLEMRTALYMLTGVDKGTDSELWINWYGDTKNSLVIAPEPPEDRPPEIRRCWTMFWGPDRGKHRPVEREDGGKGKDKPRKEK